MQPRHRCGQPLVVLGEAAEAYDTLGFGSRGGLLSRRLKGRWTEDLYDVGVALGSCPQAIQVRWPPRVGLVSSRLTCIPVEGLAASGRLQRQN